MVYDKKARNKLETIEKIVKEEEEEVTEEETQKVYNKIRMYSRAINVSIFVAVVILQKIHAYGNKFRKVVNYGSKIT